MRILLKIYLATLFFILAQIVPAQAQETLSLKAAVSQTIEQNYGIQVARKNIDIASNNTNKALLGYMPTVNANAGSNINLGGNTQINEDGQGTTVNAFTYGGNASVSANYNLYDKTRSYNLKQLNEILNLNDLQLRQTIELNVLQLAFEYYQLANLTTNLDVLQENLGLSKQRLERVSYQFEYGQGNRLDVLNAEVDLQRDSINFINASQLVDNAKRNINVILGRDVTSAFDIDTSINYIPNLSLDQMMNKALVNNIGILLSEKSTQISQYDIDIIESSKLPKISSTLSFGYNMQGTPANTIVYSDTKGLSAGVNLSWNIFDGGVRKIRKQNSLIDLQSIDLERSLLRAELERDIRNAWMSYQNALYILDAEKVSLASNQLNFDRTLYQFNLGQVNSVQFRQAQLNLINAKTSLNTAKFNAKIIETELLQLSGELLTQLD